MQDFDMMADAQAMAMMAREFSELKGKGRVEDDCKCGGESDQTQCRRDLIAGICDGGCQGGHGNHGGSDCDMVAEGQLLEKIYFLQQDMIMMLRQLHSVSPHEAREEIACVIGIKKKDSELILSCYYDCVQDELSYAPRLTHDRRYCRLLRQLIKCQQRLLMMINESENECKCLRKVIKNEFTVAYIMNCLAIYCKY